uniref:CUB domain-containing protein n=1 Tax=Anopheles farauti TaxID=69004 RepID=A0A182QRD2_9DIPT
MLNGPASNVLVSAQQQDEEVVLEPILDDTIADTSFPDDVTNYSPDAVDDVKEPDETTSKIQAPKFEDYPPLVKDANGQRIRLPGMRPKVPFDGLKLIDDQQDVELLDMTEIVSLDEIGKVFEEADDVLETSGDGDVQPQENTTQPEPESTTEKPVFIHVPQQVPKIPPMDVEDNSPSDGESAEEKGPLKHLKARALYDLQEGESKAQGVKKYLQQHPDEVILESPNYPNPYPSEIDDMRSFSVDGGRGVQITIHDLDLNPTTDFLHIRAGAENDTEEKGPVLTGTYQEPLRFLIPQTTFFTIHFVAQQGPDVEQTHRGFQLSYAPFGTVISPTTPTTTEVIVPQEELQWTTKEIVVTPEMMELPRTWTEIKQALSNASNQYVAMHNLTYMPSRPFDVKLLARKCPDTWRNYENCVSLEFAVPLRPIYYEPSDDDEGMEMGFGNRFLQKGFISITTTEATEPQYELDVGRLDEMWEEFGRMELQRAGYEMYIMPENSRVLLTWIGISLAIVGTFLFVLYMIWKIDIFKDYRRISRTSHGVSSVDDDKNELKKKEFDISMFPSPHQVVPTFFPTGDPYNAADADTQYAYDNAGMNQWPEDFNDPRYPETSFSTGGDHQHRELGNQRTGSTRPYEPVSPMDLSPAPVDFNDSLPRSARPSAGGGTRNNPFLSPRGGGGGGGGGGRGPRVSMGKAPPPPPPPPGLSFWPRSASLTAVMLLGLVKIRPEYLTLHFSPTDRNHRNRIRTPGSTRTGRNSYHYAQLIVCRGQMEHVQFDLMQHPCQDDITRSKAFVHFNTIHLRRPDVLLADDSTQRAVQGRFADAQDATFGHSVLY